MPHTVLFNELEEGQLYELIVTHFYGMPLMRYRMTDLLKVVSLKDAETGVNLPQIAIQRKVGQTISLAGLATLDEKTIWRGRKELEAQLAGRPTDRVRLEGGGRPAVKKNAGAPR